MNDLGQRRRAINRLIQDKEELDKLRHYSSGWRRPIAYDKRRYDGSTVIE